MITILLVFILEGSQGYQCIINETLWSLADLKVRTNISRFVDDDSASSFRKQRVLRTTTKKNVRAKTLFLRNAKNQVFFKRFKNVTTLHLQKKWCPTSWSRSVGQIHGYKTPQHNECLSQPHQIPSGRAPLGYLIPRSCSRRLCYCRIHC